MNETSRVTLSGNKRRQFLKQLLAGSMATLAYPVLVHANPESKNFAPSPTGDLADERYWEMVKKQFTVPPNKMMG